MDNQRYDVTQGTIILSWELGLTSVVSLVAGFREVRRAIGVSFLNSRPGRLARLARNFSLAKGNFCPLSGKHSELSLGTWRSSTYSSGFSAGRCSFPLSLVWMIL